MQARRLMLPPQRGDIVAFLDRLNAQGFIEAYYLADVAARATPTGTFAGDTLLEAGGRTALDMTLTSTTWGANGGVVFNGTTSLGTVSNDVALANLTSQAGAIICLPVSMGETDLGSFFNWGAKGVGDHRWRLLPTDAVIASIITDGTDALAKSNDNQVDYIGSKVLATFDYDDNNILGNGRRIRHHRGLDGAVRTLTLTDDNAATGTVTNQVNDLIFGNRTTTDLTFDGTMFKIVIFNANAIATIDNIYRELTRLAGV